MSLSNMQVYNEQIQTNVIELLGQKLEAFNEASLGCLVLEAPGHRGDYEQEAFWNNLAAAQRRVDRYAANGAVANTDMSQSEMVGVKIAGGFGPVAFEPSQLSWLQRDPGEAVVAIAEGFANTLLADQLNTAVLSAVAAIENQPTLVNDVTGGSTITQAALNGSHAKFGDASQMLMCDFINGVVYHQLIGDAIANNDRLFIAGNVTVVEILNKRVVVSDIPALTNGVTSYKALSLVQAGAVVSGTDDIITNMDTPNGTERLVTTWQADYSFSLKLKGYAWDIANGGPSPDDTDLATGSNWDPAVTSLKHTAGTLCIGDQS